MTNEVPPPPAWRDILVLLAAALVVVTIASVMSGAVKADSVAYMEFARALSVGQLTELHYHDYPPLYPLMVALVHAIVGDWVLAGQLVTGVLTGVSVVPLYLLGRLVLGDRVALLAGMLFVVHPLMIEWGAMVVSDGPYLCFWLWAVYFAVQAARRGRASDFVFSGMACAAAYLIRPEGLQVCVLLGVFTLGGPLSWRRKAGGLGITALVVVLLISPYVYLVSVEAGYLVLTKKKRVGHFPSTKARFGRWFGRVSKPVRSPLPQDLPPPVEGDLPNVMRRWVWAEAVALELQRVGLREGAIEPSLIPIPGTEQQIDFTQVTDPPHSIKPGGNFTSEFFAKVHPVLVVLLLLAGLLSGYGVVRERRRSGLKLQLTLVAAFGLHLCLVLFNNHRYGYVSERHLIPLAAIELLWVAWVLGRIDDRIRPRLRGWAATYMPRVRDIGIAALLVLVILGVDSLRPRGTSKAYIRELAEVIEEQSPHRLGVDGVVGSDTRLAFWSGTRHEKLDPWRGYREVVRQLIQTQSRYLYVEPAQLHKIRPFIRLGWIEPVVAPGLGLPPGKDIHIYRATFFTPVAH